MAEEGRSEPGMWQTLVPVLDAVILLTGVVGHSLVVVTLTGRGRRAGAVRGPPQGTDTLLLALSGADLLLLACLPFHTAAIALGRWPFGHFLCKAISFLGVACSSASVFTLSALAVTRYLVVVHPAWAYRARLLRRPWLVPAGLWLPAVALGAPQFIFRTVGSSTQLSCFAFLSGVSQLIYSTALFLLGFALPLLVIVLMYAKIYLFLRRARASAHAPRLQRYQSRVTHTSALLVLVFTLCWLPSYALMLSLVGRTLADAPSYGTFAIFARLLASSATVANPVLYVFMSRKFRKDLLALGRGRCCGRADTVRPLDPAQAGEVPQS
ncbi:somatostatin receptor type 5 [Conger conger]|uniref:somatostatin receptor type 5 n=1 Tax=Conger conger TaxID=82655 RepID=UPI002A5A1617|nr:somatostatin receptor type 5 [Conger conger]